MGRINPLLLSSGLLLMLCATYVFPVSILFPYAQAIEGEEEEIELSLVVGDDVELLLDPGIFSVASQSVTVTTSNPTGYTLTIETLGASSSMVNTDIVGSEIPTLSNDGIRLSDDFPYGYGYSLDGEL